LAPNRPAVGERRLARQVLTALLARPVRPG